VPIAQHAYRKKFVVMVWSVRADRQGIRAARFVERTLSGRGHEVTLVDPCELHLPLLDRMYTEYPRGQAPAVLERLAELHRRALGSWW
jgi:NAD(P)H-dependent FMN reductase